MPTTLAVDRSPSPATSTPTPGSQLVLLRGIGHVSNVEAADRFNAELRAFLLAAG
jgi:pimeloyl-ACP methyl ester carboxylesterase